MRPVWLFGGADTTIDVPRPFSPSLSSLFHVTSPFCRHMSDIHLHWYLHSELLAFIESYKHQNYSLVRHGIDRIMRFIKAILGLAWPLRSVGRRKRNNLARSLYISQKIRKTKIHSTAKDRHQRNETN